MPEDRWPGLDFPLRRIFCIGRNYAAHARELGNAVPEAPVVFMKPPSALLGEGEPLRLPRGRGAVHHEAELVVALDEAGGVAAATLGLDLTLREEQDRLKRAGLPWELAKAFDGSAPLGRFLPAAGLDLAALEFRCEVNGRLRQSGSTRDMLFPLSGLLDFLARHWRLGAGDAIFTGTPPGVGPLEPGDAVVLESAALGHFTWRCL